MAAAVSLAGLAGLAGCGAEPPADARPDVVLIMVDTLRPDHLGYAGYARDTSPAIDLLARDSLRFGRAYSHAPLTRISVASLLTGRLPHRTGILEHPGLPAGVDTLAERLGSAGYRTAAVIGNYVLRAGRGYEQGFQVYDDEMSSMEQQRRWPERVAEDTTDRAIELLEAEGAGPLFLWIVYQDPHGPYTPPYETVEGFRRGDPEPRPLERNRSLSGRGGIPSYQQVRSSRDYYDYVSHYDGEIRYLDEHLRRLVDALKIQGLYDSALIVFTSDHGEGMGEHDYYFAHGEYLYQHQIRVPLLLRHGPERRGARDEVVRHVDVAATVLAAAGLPPDPALPGRDLREPPDDGPTDVFAAMHSPLVDAGERFALVRDGFKLIHTPAEDRSEFYDLVRDPDERRDLADSAEHAERRAALRRALDELLAQERLEVAPGDAPAEPSEAERRQLEALGYLE